MELNEQQMKINEPRIHHSLNKWFPNLILPITAFIILAASSCETFVEVEPPKNILASKTVFIDAATVESTLANLYLKMRQGGFVSGNFSLGISMGIYADELDYFGTDPNILRLYNHNVTPSDGTVSQWWDLTYNIIYATNDIVDGLENSNHLSLEDKNKFKGQALFVRAYIHSLLVSLFGDIPYLTTTNYSENNKTVRMSVNAVYDNIITDLIHALALLEEPPSNTSKLWPHKSVANALLARIYLYKEDWSMAESFSSTLIDSYFLEPDLNKVFLKNSPETIWQLKLGANPQNTYEALQLIISSIPTQGVALTSNLMDAFEPNDLRKTFWTESITSANGLTTLFYAHKYKATHNTTTESLEYPIVFRLSEQYLIRAEARVRMGDLVGAMQDVNVIRNRAGLPNITTTIPDEAMDAIIQERRVELFTEQGQRWFDLKRLSIADDLLAPIKSGWQSTDIWFPIPEKELLLNKNLRPQNSGY
ncbi:RagB/SusD family nutrient uptake outer membrane protein [Gelidibacter japonicus]|uniref:RagB/SusD family nutrient uptake outer membrane protein n=1 Tax=Gelidibacter japonicus TaxID=1962232 RepID=UPI003A90435B